MGKSEECRLAVIVGNYPPDEPFVRRHLTQLFGGVALVIVLGEDSGQRICFDSEKVLCIREHINSVRRAETPLGRLFFAAKSVFKKQVISEESREVISSALRAHEIQAVLGEFGTHSEKLYPAVALAKIPHFAYFRGADATQVLSGGLKSFINGRKYRRMASKIDGIFAVSNFVKNRLNSYGIFNRRFDVVPSGTDVSFFAPGEKRFKSVVSVGRFVEKKAPQVSLRAFLEIASRHPEAVFHMIGDGPLLKQCKDIAAKHPNGSQVSFHGRLTSEQIRCFLAESRLFVQHSVTARNGDAEGLPSAIQEAMASGCAILSTRHAGISEAVIEGQNGHLTDEHDIEAFINLMDRMLSDSDLLEKFGKRSRALAEEHFDYRVLFRKIEVTILDAIAQYPPVTR